MKGKPWKKAEVEKLDLVEAKKPLDVIAAQFPEYSVEAVRQKCRRLGLEVVDQHSTACSTTSTLRIPKDLWTLPKFKVFIFGLFLDFAHFSSVSAFALPYLTSIYE